jgi:histone H3/H4
MCFSLETLKSTNFIDYFMSKNILSNSAMAKLLKSAGAERVSDSAKEELRKLLESTAKEISEKAVNNALKSGRKTIQKQDINSTQ